MHPLSSTPHHEAAVSEADIHDMLQVSSRGQWVSMDKLADLLLGASQVPRFICAYSIPRYM